MGSIRREAPFSYESVLDPVKHPVEGYDSHHWGIFNLVRTLQQATACTITTAVACT